MIVRRAVLLTTTMMGWLSMVTAQSFSSWLSSSSSSTLPSLLMIGNSYTAANHLVGMVQALLAESSGVSPSHIRVTAHNPGGARWEEHVEDPIVQDLIRQQSWTWIVLQEQSEVPAFSDTYYNLTYQLSCKAVIRLNEMIVQSVTDRSTTGSTTTSTNTTTSSSSTATVLFMTWGRRLGDVQYPEYFPDFVTMNSKLSWGYEHYQELLSTPERPVSIAPVGVAFQAIYDSYLGWNNIDPTDEDTDFSHLYQLDGSHPSVAGSYLTACVLVATLTGQDITQRRWAPWGISPTTRDRLQSVAAATVDIYNAQNPINEQAALQTLNQMILSTTSGASSTTVSTTKKAANSKHASSSQSNHGWWVWVAGTLGGIILVVMGSFWGYRRLVIFRQKRKPALFIKYNTLRNVEYDFELT